MKQVFALVNKPAAERDKKFQNVDEDKGERDREETNKTEEMCSLHCI